jgi:hypothetical protein
MEKLIKFFTIFILVLFFSSCSSDSSDDGCTPITCLNGGISNSNCGCDCPQGFTGSNCSTQIMPTSIKILKVRVKKFPNLKDNGDQWDQVVTGNFVRPDLNIDIKIGDVVLYDSNVLDDRTSNSNCTDTHDFFPNLALNSTGFNSQLSFRLFDYDITSYDFMGSYNTFIYSSTSGFPTTLLVGNCNNTLVFELTLQYVW